MNWRKRDSSETIASIIERNTGFDAEEFRTKTWKTEIANLEEAVALIAENMSTGKISIFGDYDADGITASAILWSTIKTFSETGIAPNIRLPRRFSEGYGFSETAAAEFDGDDLLITVDNGIAAIKAINVAKAKGMKVLVIDHHLPGSELPDADVIVNPHVFKPTEDSFEDWCGAGLAYRVCERLIELSDKPERLKSGFMKFIVQLAAVGTICDVMPLIKDNRTIVVEGLKAINEAPCKGIRAIMELTETSYVDEDTCGFLIGPLLNASGRMDDDGAIKAFDVLTACQRNCEVNLKSATERLIDVNEIRKAAVEDAYEKAMTVIADDCLYGDCPLVVPVDGISEGIIGIVASKLCEEFKVPSIVLTMGENGLLKGSARGYGGVNVKSMLDAAAKHLERYGGHEGAGGLSLEEDKLFEAKSAMATYAASNYSVEEKSDILYDLEIDESEIGKVFEEVKKYAPYGTGNPKIVFKIKRFTLSPRLGQFCKLMGSRDEHIKLYGNNCSAVGFKLANIYCKDGNKAIACVGSLGENIYRGKREVQIEMLDFRHADEAEKSPLAQILASKMRRL